MNNIFETAARNKVRFETSKGLLSAEDLFDLPLTSTKGPSLDNLAQSLYRAIKETDEISFVSETPKVNAEFHLRLDIVKRVIGIKQEEAATALQARERKAQKERIMELMAHKQDEQLAGKSFDELQAMLDSL